MLILTMQYMQAWIVYILLSGDLTTFTAFYPPFSDYVNLISDEECPSYKEVVDVCMTPSPPPLSPLTPLDERYY